MQLQCQQRLCLSLRHSLLSSGESSQRSATPTFSAPANLVVYAELGQDQANDWLVCTTCRTILGLRTGYFHMNQLHQRNVDRSHQLRRSSDFLSFPSFRIWRCVPGRRFTLPYAPQRLAAIQI